MENHRDSPWSVHLHVQCSLIRKKSITLLYNNCSYNIFNFFEDINVCLLKKNNTRHLLLWEKVVFRTEKNEWNVRGKNGQNGIPIKPRLLIACQPENSIMTVEVKLTNWHQFSKLGPLNFEY